MHIDGPWQFINVRDRARFNWGVAPFPAGQAGSVTWVAGSGFGISNTTDRPDKAWEALKVITSQKSLERVASSGRGYPARQSAVPAFEDPKAAPEDESLIAAVLDGKIAEVRPFLTTTTWQEIAVMLERDFNPVFLGQQSVQETIDKVVPQFNELLQKHQELLEG
jgi:multiple sugar transport system substrate-binding protein